MKQAMAVVIMVMVSCAPVHAASFDCSKAVTPDEHLVCDVPIISTLDDLLKPAYAQARQAASPDDNVPRMAHDFLTDRGACGADPSCVMATYLGILQDYSYLGATTDIPANLTAETVAMGRAVPSAALPQTVGQCVITSVDEVHPRIGDSFDSGTAVDFTNQGYQVSYSREEALVASEPRDKVIMCLISIPHHCPEGDDRGREYITTNLRTGGTWMLPDSQHACGGA